MGCLFACFSASKFRKRRHLVNAAPSKPLRDGASEAQQIYFTTKQQVTEEPIKPATESKEKLEKELSCNGKRKVTFDLNAKTYKGLSVGEATDNVVENNEKKESENKDEEPSDESKSIPNLISSDGASYPPNHRYQNYTKEESEDLDLEDSDFDDVRDNVGVDGKILVQEESSESLFSLSIDSRKYVCGAEVGEKEVSSPMPECNSPHEELKPIGCNPNIRDRTRYVDSVLNPVENLAQWKAVKGANLPLHHQHKENINIEQHFGIHISPQPSFKLLTNNSKANADHQKPLDQEIAVDTSLSSWLVESETTSLSKGSATSVRNSASGRASSPRSHKDRPILGELTMKELKQVSPSTSSRQGRSQSLDEIPIIGTVGSYWRHTGRTMDSDSGSSSKGMLNTMSKSGEDEKVKWNSTPFEARLERALDKVSAQVQQGSQ
ncbi:hypothetical protein P3X46_008324 [Hevea brasiliensis]|uniref:Uncharacterized protein n=1 Tax=Hevea brasiliensis TaxID=3981 RepID=A0ABQ9MI76_HEVBR|nr:uncharacterized protein LOC110643267 [Hevea brasiliensis]KAJ9180017.1 hypothetical protein P3X46_008324 [Hevea brasiliensis]